jgi:hypothetical protein
MDFLEPITTYYNTESKYGFINGMAAGIVMLLMAVLLWSFSNNQSISKGMAAVLFMGGFIAGIGGYIAGSSAKRELPEKLQLYKSDKQRFLEKEFEKVEKIHKSWTGIKIFWTAFIVLGVVLIFTTAKPFWTGVAIGSLILGTIGHIGETQSMKHNERYYNQVLQERIR